MTERTLSAQNATQIIFLIVAAVCLLPFVSSGVALLLGLCLALFIGNPYLSVTQSITPKLLQASVIGLGAGMNLEVIAKVGLHGIGYTATGIFLTTLIGLSIGYFLKLNKEVSLLVTMGTAICGGSAIAAVASTIRAKPSETSVALATVFFLNAMALFIFPVCGHYFGLNETQFGLWSALAIHDTSSVVGAALAYGGKAVEVATTVKLARALWIIPLCLAIGVFFKIENGDQKTAAKKPTRPWFILGFVAVAALVTWIPFFAVPGKFVYTVATRSLVFTLFLIGANLSRDSLKKVGFRPFVQGVALWGIVASATLLAIQMNWIS